MLRLKKCLKSTFMLRLKKTAVKIDFIKITRGHYTPLCPFQIMPIFWKVISSKWRKSRSSHTKLNPSTISFSTTSLRFSRPQIPSLSAVLLKFPYQAPAPFSHPPPASPPPQPTRSWAKQPRTQQQSQQPQQLPRLSVPLSATNTRSKWSFSIPSSESPQSLRTTVPFCQCFPMTPGSAT